MAIHITGMKIEAFRGLKDLAVADCNHINLVVGDNNSGKSSVLEALMCAHGGFTSGTLFKVMGTRGKFSRMSGLVDQMQWLFPYVHDVRQNIRMQISLPEDASFDVSCKDIVRMQDNETYKKVSALLSESFQILLERINREQKKDLGKNHPPKKFNDDIGLNTVAGKNSFDMESEEHGLRITVRENGQEAFSEEIWSEIPLPLSFNSDTIPLIFMAPYSHRDESRLADAYSEIAKKGREKEQTFLELLRLFDADIEDVQILTNDGRPVVYLQHAKAGRAPLSIFGDGQRRIFSIASLLAKAEDGVLVVDEVDTAIHHSAMEKTFSWLARAAEQQNTQLFLTTHSLEAVDAFIDATTSERLALYKLAGGTSVRRMSGGQLGRIRRERGLDVR